MNTSKYILSGFLAIAMNAMAQQMVAPSSATQTAAPDATANVAARTISIAFENTGTVGAFFHVRTALGAENGGQGTGPWGYTVENDKSLTDTWTLLGPRP